MLDELKKFTEITEENILVVKAKKLPKISEELVEFLEKCFAEESQINFNFNSEEYFVRIFFFFT